MDIQDYLNKQLNIDHVRIARITLIAKLNVTNIDLDQLYDKLETSDDSIQLVEYNDKIKYSQNMSGLNNIRVKRHSKRKEQHKKSCLSRCIHCQFDRSSIKIFENGKMQMVANYNSTYIEQTINAILKTIDGDTNITEIRPVYLRFDIMIKHINKDTLLVNDVIDTNSFHQHALYKYKSNLIFRIQSRLKAIIGNAKSIDDIQEFIEFIKPYVEFENDSLNITDEMVLDDDTYELQVCI